MGKNLYPSLERSLPGLRRDPGPGRCHFHNLYHPRDRVNMTPYQKEIFWSSHRGLAETNLTSIREDARSASLSGLKIQRCHELWCRSQRWLRSGVAVAVAQTSGCSSNQTPSLGTSICLGPKKKKKKKEEGKLSSLRGVHTQLPQVQVWWSQVLALLHPPCWEI